MLLQKLAFMKYDWSQVFRCSATIQHLLKTNVISWNVSFSCRKKLIDTFLKYKWLKGKPLHTLDHGKRLFGFKHYSLTAWSQTPAASLMMSISPCTYQQFFKGLNSRAIHFRTSVCQSYLRKVYEQCVFLKRKFINNITWYLNFPKRLRTKASDVCWYASFKSYLESSELSNAVTRDAKY